MRLLNRLRNCVRSLFGGGNLETDMDAEIRMHLELRAEKFMAAGMSPTEAEFAARRSFGGLERIKEEVRDQWAGVWLGQLMQDLRYGIHMMLKGPMFSFIAVLSLALGIGAATAIFSLVNAVLLGSLPVPNPQDLRVLKWGASATHMAYWGVSDGTPGHEIGEDFSLPALRALRTECADQAEILGYVPTYEGILARARHETVTAQGLMVSGNFFSALGVHPLFGTLINDQDDHPGAAPKVVISYRWWDQQFGLDPGVLGEQVLLNGRSFTVVGVLPRGFTGVRTGSQMTDLYFAISVQPHVAPAGWRVNAPDFWWVALMARLKPGVSDAQFKAVLDVSLRRASDKVLTHPEALLSEGRDGPDENRADYQRVLLPLLGVVGIVLIITCANLAGLLLARGAARRHELAIRIAIGASRWRLVSQLITECLLLSSIGGSLGLLVSLFGKSAVSRILAGSREGLRYDTSTDLKVIGFAIGVTLLTGLFSGIYPALRAGSRDPLLGLKDQAVTGNSRLRIGHFLVMAQVCLSLLLIVVAGLYVRTIINLTRIDPGFVVRNVLLFHVNPSNAGFKEGQNRAYYAKVQDALASIPGVESASLIPYPFLANTFDVDSFTIPGQPTKGGPDPSAHIMVVGERFFSTMSIPLMEGRELRESDSDSAPKVLVVNEAFARKYFPGKIPVGQVITFGGTDWQVVGVCRDTKYVRLNVDAPVTAYFSFRQKTPGTAYFALRTALPPLAMAMAVRKAVAAVDINIPLDDLTTQEDLRNQTIGVERTIVALCGSLAALTVLLSCIGLFGLISYDVARRTAEVGVRMALGATRGQIFTSILKVALVLAGAGVAVGVPLAMALTRIYCTNLYGLTPTDPITFCGSVGIMLAVALLAASVPASRAARIDPMAALRRE
ncbi:MAG: ABC transporter permease [Opitutaceae bacterium]